MAKTPWMKLDVPTVTVTPGPDWAAAITATLNKIDAHDHTTGNGVPIIGSASAGPLYLSCSALSASASAAATNDQAMSGVLYPMSAAFYPISGAFWPVSSSVVAMSSAFYPISGAFWPVSSSVVALAASSSQLSSTVYPLSSSWYAVSSSFFTQGTVPTLTALPGDGLAVTGNMYVSGAASLTGLVVSGSQSLDGQIDVTGVLNVSGVDGRLTVDPSASSFINIIGGKTRPLQWQSGTFLTQLNAGYAQFQSGTTAAYVGAFPVGEPPYSAQLRFTVPIGSSSLINSVGRPLVVSASLFAVAPSSSFGSGISVTGAVTADSFSGATFSGTTFTGATGSFSANVTVVGVVRAGQFSPLGAGTVLINATSPNVSGALGTVIDNTTQFTVPGSKLVSIRNAGVEVVGVDLSGVVNLRQPYCESYEVNEAGSNITLTTSSAFYQWVTGQAGDQLGTPYAVWDTGSHGIRIQAQGAGVYSVMGAFAVTLDGAAEIRCQLYKNGSPITHIRQDLDVSNQTKYVGLNFSGIEAAVSGDIFDVRFGSDTNGRTASVKHANFSMFRIS